MPTSTPALIDRSARLETAGIDFDEFVPSPLDPATLRCLRYMHDVEGHTMCYLRDVLVTRAHRDAELTAFLACWAYEELWHGEAIAAVLARHGEVAGRERLAANRVVLPRRDAWRPVAFSLASALTPHLPTVHMAWGALNEWTTQAGYARLASLSGHPQLAELLSRIMRQEGRHIDLYARRARDGLASSRTARRLTRWAMEHFWAPVGSGVMPEGEVAFLVGHLFGDEGGMETVRRIDRQMDRLPGLEGMCLVERAVSALRALEPPEPSALPGTGDPRVASGGAARGPTAA